MLVVKPLAAMLTVSSSGGRSRSKSPGRRDKSPMRAVSPPRSSKSASSRSKKYREPSETESSSGSDSEEDARRARRSSKRDEKKDRRRRKSESESETEEEEEEDGRAYGKYDTHGREYADGRHPSYAAASPYEYAQLSERARHMSMGEGRGAPPPQRQGSGAHDVPGSFHGHDDRDAHGTRHMSFVDVEPHDPRRAKVYQAEPRAYAAAEPPQGYVAMPAGHADRYAPAPKYEYAQPSHNIKYLPKAEALDRDVRSRDGKQYYVQTPHAQIDVDYRKPSRKDSDDKHRRSAKDRDDEDDRRKAASRKDPHRSRRDDSDSDSERDKRGKYKSSRREDLSSGSERDRRAKHRSRHDDSSSGDDRRGKHDKSRGLKDKDRAQVVEIRPGQKSLAVDNGKGGRSHRLSVSGAAPGAMMLVAPGAMALGAPGQHMHMGALPPGSPLLEAYRGTYQSISPMPSPMALPLGMDDGMSDLEPLEPEYSSDDSQHRRHKKTSLKKRVEIYDPEPDALAIAAELKHPKPASKPLIKILPPLSDDNMMHLRTEYKKHFKVNGKGINVAKHIKLKVPGNIGKAAYATALGRWESEAHWANFWYQSGSSRRELLIESLIGRSNAEIRKIKEAFNDKRYNDSLEKCMQTELKKDKFRHAILVAIQERRQDELSPLSKTQIAEDVRDLYKALVSKDGGETSMIDIIVVRSDLHLRQVLQQFEIKYKRNFAREMIQKSQNLVVSFKEPCSLASA